MRVQGNIGASLQASFLAALIGCIPAAFLFAIVTIWKDGSRDWSPENLILVPGLAAFAGLFGWLIAIPAALLLGTPLAWRLGDHMAAVRQKAVLPFALLGGVCGWAIFLLLFDGQPWSGSGGIWRDGCLIFGAVVGAALPLAVAWLDESKVRGTMSEDPRA